MDPNSPLSNLLMNLKMMPEKTKKALVVMGVFILLVIAGFVIKNIVDKAGQPLTIKNSGKYLSSAPDDYEKTLLAQIYAVAKDSLPADTDENTFIHDAEIRKDSFTENKENGVTSTHFLLDIDSLKMTYAVDFAWSKDKKKILSDSIVVNCPPISEMKYPETKCYGMYNNTSSPELYLPYTAFTDDGQIKYQVTLSEDLYIINIYTNACNDKSLENEYKEEALKWLKSTPINYQNYSLYYNNVCKETKTEPEYSGPRHEQ